MPADSLHCKVAALELNEILGGGRIDKITMPEPDEIVLSIHGKGKFACVMSANPSLPRLHVTDYAPKNNPQVAPSFLMHLRKHIGGAVIKSVTCREGERIISFNLCARNELGYEEEKTLLCEIMGKYANIILCDCDGKISECIKHISPAGSEKRPVLPGLKYEFPPRQSKADLFESSELRALLESFGGGKLDSFILAGGAGLAPSTITAFVTFALGGVYADSLSSADIEKLSATFTRFTHAEDLRPCIRKEGNKSDFWIYPFFPDGEYTFFHTLDKAMDEYYYSIDRDRRITEKSHIPKTTVKNAIARTEKKLKLFIERKNEASDLERDRLYGELITANIYRLRQGMKSFEAENYYEDPPVAITVPLLENKSPQFNAQAYFRKYAKKKKTLSMVEDQIEQAQNDLEYFKSVYDSFSYTDSQGLNEIITELTQAGLLHEPKIKRKPDKEQAASELKYDGCTIRWGKTNLQNDRVTKSARGDDVWLHTQKIHGSHVTVSGENITPAAIERAAQIAAYYSQARQAEKVPVDYTLRKNVSKPKGSPPGKAIYVNYKTIMVSPRDERN